MDEADGKGRRLADGGITELTRCASGEGAVRVCPHGSQPAREGRQSFTFRRGRTSTIEQGKSLER